MRVVNREDDGCTSEFEQGRHRQQIAAGWRRHAANRLVLYSLLRAILYVILFSRASSDTGARRSSLVEHEFRHLGGICRKIISVICLSRFDLFFFYLFYPIGYVTRKFKKIIFVRGEIVYLFMLESVFISLLKEDIWIVLIWLVKRNCMLIRQFVIKNTNIIMIYMDW